MKYSLLTGLFVLLNWIAGFSQAVVQNDTAYITASGARGGGLVNYDSSGHIYTVLGGSADEIGTIRVDMDSDGYTNFARDFFSDVTIGYNGRCIYKPHYAENNSLKIVGPNIHTNRMPDDIYVKPYKDTTYTISWHYTKFIQGCPTANDDTRFPRTLTRTYIANIVYKVGNSSQLSIEHQYSPTSTYNPATIKSLRKNEFFDVCADGSDHSFFVVTGNQDMMNIGIRTQNNDESFNGKFTVITRNANRLIVQYKHPDSLEAGFPASIINYELYRLDSPSDAFERRDIRVRRAPVVMVHGLNADASSFEKMEASLLKTKMWDKTMLYRADYKLTNASSFSTNSGVVPAAIDKVKAQMLDQRIAVGKVDVVVHSMGGLLTRQYLQSNRYANDIHKFIMLNTPHSGSQIANTTKNLTYDRSTSLPILPTVALRNLAFVGIGNFIDKGAINDLQVDSPAITQLNAAPRPRTNPVPSHAIVTTLPFRDPIFSSNGAPAIQHVDVILVSFLNTNLNTILRQPDHDWVVSKTSQMGGLASAYCTFIDGQMHMGSPANNRSIEVVTELLQLKSSAPVFAQNGFAPVSLTLANPQSQPIPAKMNTDQSQSPAVRINLPLAGSTYLSGKTLPINVTGTDLERIDVLVNYSTDSCYINRYTGTSVSANMTVDTINGKRTIIAIGKTANGYYVSDTASFFVNSHYCESIRSGDWTNESTWSCNRIPTSSDVVILSPTHTITIYSDDVRAKRLVHQGGILLYMKNTSKLFVSSQNGSN